MHGLYKVFIEGGLIPLANSSLVFNFLDEDSIRYIRVYETSDIPDLLIDIPHCEI